MSQRNSIIRTLAARFTRLAGSAHSALAIAGIALAALGVVSLMAAASAAASHAAALTLGGLLLAGAFAATRRSNQPIRCPLQFRRVRMHPVRIVDRNHR